MPMIGSPKLLTENEVVQAVTANLRHHRWYVESFATTMQTGIDIHATRNGIPLYVEAKGVTSSKEGSSRYGRVQTSSQIFIQVAAALLKCAELKSFEPSACVAMAIPSHSLFRARIKRIEPILRAGCIGVFWVDDDGSVNAWNAPWLVDVATR